MSDTLEITVYARGKGFFDIVAVEHVALTSYGRSSGISHTVTLPRFTIRAVNKEDAKEAALSYLTEMKEKAQTPLNEPVYIGNATHWFKPDRELPLLPNRSQRRRQKHDRS